MILETSNVCRFGDDTLVLLSVPFLLKLLVALLDTLFLNLGLLFSCLDIAINVLILLFQLLLLHLLILNRFVCFSRYLNRSDYLLLTFLLISVCVFFFSLWTGLP